jgi:uncharacterized protein
MPVGKSPSDPSMEEIIASISRLIAEDKEPASRRAGSPSPAEADPRALGGSSDILELTQVVNQDGSVRRVSPWAEVASAPPSALEAPTTSAVEAAGRIEPLTPHAEAAPEPTLETGRERIISAASSGAAAAAFARLTGLPHERRNETERSLGGAERSLEEIVREMLRPLLQAWLDSHLPGIVERLVREEIARVAGEAGLR